GQAAYAAIAEARNRDLREISDAQSALTAAAARPDALQAVLQQLSTRTGAWTALFDAQGNELFSAGPRPASPTPRLLRDLAIRTTARSTRDHVKGRPPPPAAAAHHVEGVHLTVHILPPAARTGTPLRLGQPAPAPPPM